MKTIQLKPSCKDYLWGGEKLRTEYGIQSEMHPLSEAWMLSCHPDGPSYLPDGTTLQQYAPRLPWHRLRKVRGVPHSGKAHRRQEGPVHSGAPL